MYMPVSSIALALDLIVVNAVRYDRQVLAAPLGKALRTQGKRATALVLEEGRVLGTLWV